MALSNSFKKRINAGLEGFSPPTGKAARDGGGRAKPRLVMR